MDILGFLRKHRFTIATVLVIGCVAIVLTRKEAAPVVGYLALGVVIVIVGMASFLAAGIARIKKARSALMEAAQCLDSGDDVGAIKKLRDACRGKGTDAMLLVQIAQIEIRQEQYDAAHSDLDAAEKLAGPTDWLTTTRSRVFAAAGEFDQAIELLKKARGQSPESLHIPLSLAHRHLDAGHPEPARVLLEEMTQLVQERTAGNPAEAARWNAEVDRLRQHLSEEQSSD